MRVKIENWPFLAGPLIGAAVALLLGQDANWDLRVYHYYNPYALLAGRHALDIMPVLNPSYYNPALDLPFFILMQVWPAWAVGAMLGAIQGLAFPLLYLLARHLLPAATPRRDLAGALLAALGASGAIGLTQLGATFHDNTLAVLTLASLLGVLIGLERATERRPLFVPLFLGGLAAGAAFGLKLTMALYVVGFGAALAAALPPRHWKRALPAAVLGAALGFLIAGGPWYWHLWTTYGNPVFPHFNDIFRSPFAGAVDFRDLKFIEKLTFLDRLVLPAIFSVDSRSVAETDFRDLRILMAMLLSLPALALLWRGDWKARAVVTFGAASYLAWVWLYCIYRYIVPLEMLAPVIGLAALRLAGISAAAAARAALIVFIVAAAFTQYPPSQRVAYGDRFVSVDAPAIEQPERTLLLLAGDQPSGFILPHLPERLRFVRLNDWPYLFQTPDRGFEPVVRRLIAGHDGKMLLLTHPLDRGRAKEMAALFGLRLGHQCVDIRTNLVPEPYLLCPVEKSR